MFANLFENIVYQNCSHMTSGIIGTKYIMELLTSQGNSDLAYDIASQTTYPSWGYMIENGATTLWELWQLRAGPSMNSHNHPMFGSVGSWFYKALAGISLAPKRPGSSRSGSRPRWSATSVMRRVRSRLTGAPCPHRGRGETGMSGSMPSSRSAAGRNRPAEVHSSERVLKRVGLDRYGTLGDIRPARPASRRSRKSRKA